VRKADTKYIVWFGFYFFTAEAAAYTTQNQTQSLSGRRGGGQGATPGCGVYALGLWALGGTLPNTSTKLLWRWTRCFGTFFGPHVGWAVSKKCSDMCPCPLMALDTNQAQVAPDENSPELVNAQVVPKLE
jgi:hypothetical protein